jgi:hypothetical protein
MKGEAGYLIEEATSFPCIYLSLRIGPSRTISGIFKKAGLKEFFIIRLLSMTKSRHFV